MNIFPDENKFFFKFSASIQLVIAGCRDADREAIAGLCQSWAKANICALRPQIMEIYCKKTCGFCSKLITLPFYLIFPFKFFFVVPTSRGDRLALIHLNSFSVTGGPVLFYRFYSTMMKRKRKNQTKTNNLF